NVGAARAQAGCRFLEYRRTAPAQYQAGAKLGKTASHGGAKTGAASRDQNALSSQQVWLKHVFSSLFIEWLVPCCPDTGPAVAWLRPWQLSRSGFRRRRYDAAWPPAECP